MTRKRSPHNDISDAKMSVISKTLSDLIESAKTAAQDDNNAEFLLAEKKIMLIGISHAVNYMTAMSKKKSKADLGNVRHTLLGTLATIMELDSHLPTEEK